MAVEKETSLADLNGVNGLIIEGADPDTIDGSNYAGYVVRGAGDINGDGFDDIVVGSKDDLGITFGGINAYEAYVVFGSAENTERRNLSLSSLDGTNGFVLKGVESYSFSGIAVDGVGDINGDGIDDLIVGDYGADPNGDNAGAGYVVFGTTAGFDSELALSTLDGNDGFVINGVAAGDRSGKAVSGAGDINNDGIDDLIVGAFTAAPNGTRSGESYVVFGTTAGFSDRLELSDLDGSNGFTLKGIAAEDLAGVSVSSAGDVNNDGFDDLIVGAFGAEASYVIFGQETFEEAIELSSLNGTDGFVINGTGGVVSEVSDVNDDGIDDLAISNGSNESYIVFGSSTGFGTTLALTGLDGTNGFAIDGGNAISGAGDTNGDGIDDFIVGDSSEGDDGKSYVVFGSSAGFDSTLALSDLNGLDGFVLNGVVDGLDGRGAGTSVDGVGEFNGDGLDDVTIGASLPRDRDRIIEGTNEIYLVFGQQASEGAIARNDTASTDEDTITSGNVLDNDDSRIAANRNNLSITAVNGTTADVGKQTALNSDALLTLNADGTFDYDPNNQFELLNSGSSDVDSFSYTVTDGVDTDTATVTVTINGVTDSTSPETVFDLADLDGSNGFVINGLSEGDRLGVSVSRAGDINGDGLDDFVVGASGVDASTGARAAGASYVVFGSQAGFSGNLNPASLDGSNGFVLEGADAEAFSGTAVSGAGDINGDGLDDLVVATASYSFVGGPPADIYVLFGSTAAFDGTINASSLDGTNGFVLRRGSENTGGFSLPAISGAGDINGDGIDDFVVGSPGSQIFGGSPGTSYVVFGSANGFESGLNLASLDGSDGFGINGINASRYSGDIAGSSVNEAGDINGDGLDDLFIGAGGTNESYIVFGSTEGFSDVLDLADLDGRNGFVLNGPGSSAVSSAGDVNGDGITDLIIGAPSAGSGDNPSGVSYVVFGDTSGFSARIGLDQLNGTDGFIVEGANSGEGFGSSVSDAGDVNGDGIDDLLVGADGDRLTTEGDRAYVIFGSATGFDATVSLAQLDLEDGFIIEGAGNTVSGAGDINGDGTDDLLVGSPYANPNGRYSGASYVIFGSTDTSSTPDPEVTNPLNPVSSGTDGNNGITGTEAADSIEGLAGNDVLDGRAGDDSLDGGEGTDTALYQFDSAGVVIDLSAGTATDGFGDTDTLISIENVIGSDFDDTLAGDNNNNSLTGRKGNDTLEGGLGDDTILGGEGADRLIGGDGSDSFLYVSAAEGGDAIADFEPGTDKLLLIGAAFGGLPKGAVSAELFFTGAEASLRSQRIGYNPETGAVLFDANGSGSTSAQTIATLTEKPIFNSSDITVV